MPTLVTPEGEVLTESAAIVLTLDERFPQARLLPPVASAERARALRGALPPRRAHRPSRALRPGPPLGPPRAGHRAMDRWAQVEAARDGRPWALGGSMSALDFYVSVLGRWIEDAEWRARAPQGRGQPRRAPGADLARRRGAPLRRPPRRGSGCASRPRPAAREKRASDRTWTR
jgi:glutathione S-transferase